MACKNYFYAEGPREKGYYTSRRHLDGMSGWSHRLDTPALKSCAGETNPLRWLKDHWKAMGTERLWEAWTPSWGTCTCRLAPEEEQRSLLQQLPGFPWPGLTTCTLAQEKQTLQLCSLHVTAWHWIKRTQDWGNDSTMGCRGILVPRWSLGEGSSGHCCYLLKKST